MSGKGPRQSANSMSLWRAALEAVMAPKKPSNKCITAGSFHGLAGKFLVLQSGFGDSLTQRILFRTVFLRQPGRLHARFDKIQPLQAFGRYGCKLLPVAKTLSIQREVDRR